MNLIENSEKIKSKINAFRKNSYKSFWLMVHLIYCMLSYQAS